MGKPKRGGAGRLAALVALAGAVLAALPAGAETVIAQPPHPDGVAWPSEGWESAPLPDGARAAVGALIEKAMAGEKGGLMGETRAIVIIHQGRLVAEAYRDSFGPDTKQVSWSMAKSITHALVGRAVAEGLIADIDAPMPSPWPESDPRAAITWRHWLNMVDGLDYTELQSTGLYDNDVALMMYGPGRYDVTAYVRDLPLAHEPGSHWNYSTAGLHLVGRALGQVVPDVAAAGEPGEAAQRLAFWSEDVLYAPLGMAAVPEFDAAGTFLGGSLVWASARDFAKFGYLYLRDGVWEGEQLLPEGWVTMARTKTPAGNANVYGSGWWIQPDAPSSHPTQATNDPPLDAYSAQGHEGQIIWIVPSRDVIVVRLGLMSNSDADWAALRDWCQRVARAFPEAG